ncbi:elongation factor G [Cellulosilyticum sp. I15G10I2]|uniref:elongation factor G n=1 Tax=Cellulosilyticum sp. I15G10I2 TaxID=1892843 RepID=UPI00085BEF8F|nr:elongation factor G [Cellulosilyticum sp. I15G10I2]
MKLYETKFIRNIALLGHGGAGKTTLAEAMLYTAGMTNRLGKVNAGNTVSDFDPEEIKRKISIRTSLIPVEWKDYKLNILDTPGYFDFAGGVKEAMSVADSALIIIKGTAGVEVGTEKAWEYAAAADVPKMMFITEMDAENVDIEAILTECKEKFGMSIAPVQVPWYEGSKFVGYVHVLKMLGRRFDGSKVVTCPIPEELQEKIAPIRTMILEAVAETDEVLMEKYFAEEEITLEEIQAAFKKGVMEKQIVPVLCGSSVNSTGISVLMDTMISLFPSPDEGNKDMAVQMTTNEKLEITCTNSQKTSLFIFKTIVDPFIGKFSLFKVKTGTVSTDDMLLNTRTEEMEKLSHLYVLVGKEQKEVGKLYAGDIGAVAKLKTPKTSDTLSDKTLPIIFNAVDFPKPYVKMAIFPMGKGDEEKMSSALGKLMSEDPTFYIEYDKETHETVIYGLGQQQLDIIVSMLKSKFKVDVYLENPTTRYRETIKGKINIRGKHKKQSGGHGQYGDVVMEFQPSGDLELPYVFEEKIFGGAVPRQYFPAVEKGLEECIGKGVLAGYPVVGLKAVLLDGSYHPVDSSEMAFKMATTIAFKEGLVKAQPTILEPIAHVEITTPEEYTGDIMGDMKKRRGRMIGMEIKGQKQVIVAEVPMAELYTYATDVRSMTQGRGDIYYRFEKYEEAPVDVQQKVIAARKEMA